MKIAFDHQIFGWQKYGGVSRYIFELAQALNKNHGEDVNIVSPLYINQYLTEASESLKIWGIPIPSIPKSGRIVRAANSLATIPLLRKIAPDIVHETYYSLNRIAPKRSKTIITVHDMIHELFPNSFRASDPTRQEKLAAINRADHVICVSNRTRQDLIELTGINPDKTSVVYHGFSLTAPPPQKHDAIQGKPYILYVGHREGYKNFDGLLRATARSHLLKKEFRIICFGGGALSSREKISIAELGLAGDAVTQISGSDAKLASLYSDASLFVYPSLYEGFGIPPLEAMSLNCPVACSNVSSIPEVVGMAGAFFNPTNIEEMSTVIEKLAIDESERTRLIQLGRARVQNFSWARCAQETLAVYSHSLS